MESTETHGMQPFFCVLAVRCAQTSRMDVMRERDCSRTPATFTCALRCTVGLRSLDSGRGILTLGDEGGADRAMETHERAQDEFAAQGETRKKKWMAGSSPVADRCNSHWPQSAHVARRCWASDAVDAARQSRLERRRVSLIGGASAVQRSLVSGRGARLHRRTLDIQGPGRVRQPAVARRRLRDPRRFRLLICDSLLMCVTPREGRLRGCATLGGKTRQASTGFQQACDMNVFEPTRHSRRVQFLFINVETRKRFSFFACVPRSSLWGFPGGTCVLITVFRCLVAGLPQDVSGHRTSQALKLSPGISLLLPIARREPGSRDGSS